MSDGRFPDNKTRHATAQQAHPGGLLIRGDRMSDTRADTSHDDTEDTDAAPDIAIYLDEVGLGIESELPPDALFDILMEAAHAVGMATVIRASRRTN